MRSLVLLTLAACHRAPEPPAVGPWDLRYDAEYQKVYLYDAAGEPLLGLPREGLRLGVVPALDDRHSYDPHWAEAYETIWLAPTDVVDSSPNADTLLLTLTYPEGLTATLSATRAGEGRWDAHWQATGPAAVAFHQLTLGIDAEEGLYGLGEHFDRPEHRGEVRALQLEVRPGTQSGYNEAHVPVPLLLGTTGWGVLVADDHPAIVDAAAYTAQQAAFTVGTGFDSADGLRFHLYGAEHPLDLTRRYYDTTGDPLLPAEWAFGPWVWRDENRDEAQVRSDLETLRALDLPTSGYWIDRPYASGVNTFDFDPALFNDPQGMIDHAHALGFRMALWHVPYVSPEQSPSFYAEADANGWFAPEAPPLFNNWSHPIDFTHPTAVDGWGDWVRRYTDMGIEGFKLDYAEDVVVGLNGFRLPWRFHDGSDERTMHKQYTRLYHEAYARTLPSSGGFLLCRAGTWGDQVRVSVIWPGDLRADLSYHDEEIDGVGSVGGLPAAVSAGLSLGPSGFPFFASDTGGYRDAPPNKETFTRWFQHSALMPVMQIGTNSNDVAWEFNEANGFDEEMLGWYRDFTRLHLRLFPYVYTYARRLAVDGRPIARPLGLAHPELGEHPPFDYLLGDHLLVAPVVRAGERTRSVLLPAGGWIDWFTGERLEGGRRVEVDAPLSALPLFLREGGIVPLLRPEIDTLAHATAPGVDSFADDPGPLHARVALGEGTFVLWDGAQLVVTPVDAGHALRATEGDRFRAGVVWEVAGLGAAPPEVTFEGAPLPEGDGVPGWLWVDGLLRVATPAGGGEVVVKGR